MVGHLCRNCQLKIQQRFAATTPTNLQRQPEKVINRPFRKNSSHSLSYDVINISADSSWTFSEVVLLRIILPPSIKMIKAQKAQEAITPDIGTAVPLFK